MNIRDQLIHFEGRVSKAYPDPLTHAAPWTIGVGHTGPEVHEGLVWTDEQIDAALDADIAHATAMCVEHFNPWFECLNDARQAVLIGMCFQMGISGLLGFSNTLGAIRDQRWPQAAGGMMGSLWAKQTRTRANALANQMLTGEWQT